MSSQEKSILFTPESQKNLYGIKNLLSDVLIISDRVHPVTERITALGKAFTSLSTPMKVVTVAVTAFGTAISSALQYASDCEQMSGLVTQSGMAADKFQGLANAAKKYGGSAEETAKSVETLRKGLDNIQKGLDAEGLKDTLSIFNINPEGLESTDQFLEVIAARMEILKSETEKMDFGHALGLDDGTIKTLSGGLKEYRDELEKASQINAFSTEDMALAEELNSTLRDIGTDFYAIGLNVAQMLLPIMVPLFSGLKNIVDFFAKNSEMVKAMLIELSLVLGSVLISMLAKIAIAGMSAMVSFLPAILIVGALVAAFVALNYIVGEFISWLNGEDSIFDKWLGDFESFKICLTGGFRKLGKDIANVFIGIWQGIKSVFGKLVGLVQDIIAQVMALIPDWLKSFLLKTSPVAVIAKGVTKMHESKKDGSHASGLSYVPFDGYMAELHEGESVLPRSSANIWRDLQSGKDAIAATSNVPLASVPQGAISNAYQSSESNKTITIGDITIQTAATDAEGIASDLVESIKMAFNGLDTGVRA